MTIPKSILSFYRRFQAAQINTQAAALAFHTLLAIVPLVGIGFLYLQSIGVTEYWLELTRQFVLAKLNVGSGQDFENYFRLFTTSVNGPSWGLVGLVVLLYTSVSLVLRFGESLDLSLTAGRSDFASNTTWRLFLRRLFVMLGMPVALTLSLAISQWIRSDSWLNRVFSLQTAGPVFAAFIPIVVDGIVLFCVYHWIPRVRVTARQAAKAALWVAPTFELTRAAFGLYNRHAVSVQKLYGVFSVVPLFVLWVQISWALVLLGALTIQLSPTEESLRE